MNVSRWRYLVWAAVLSLTLSGLATVVYWLVFTHLLAAGAPPLPAEPTPHWLELLAGWVVVAPLVETILLAFLVGIARSLAQREWLHVLAGAVPLGLAHGLQGAGAYDAGGHAFVSVASFAVFSFVYVAWRRDSASEAYWMSAGVHMIHNFVVILVMGLHQAAVSGGWSLA